MHVTSSHSRHLSCAASFFVRAYLERWKTIDHTQSYPKTSEDAWCTFMRECVKKYWNNGYFSVVYREGNILRHWTMVKRECEFSLWKFILCPNPMQSLLFINPKFWSFRWHHLGFLYSGDNAEISIVIRIQESEVVRWGSFKKCTGKKFIFP